MTQTVYATARVLPADVYDYLELSALVEGGVGGRTFDRFEAHGYAPCCIWGHAGSGSPSQAFLSTAEHMELAGALEGAGVSFADNDAAVRRINARKTGYLTYARVSWEEYVAELNIVRGDA